VLPLLINDWRNKWRTNLPFMIVQLPAFGPFQNSNQGSTWAELREAQTMALTLPNTAIAITYDVGNPQNLHPTNKAPVGIRLADAALNKVYHMPNADVSPMYQSASFLEGAAIITFTHTNKGLSTKNSNTPKGFELAGADHKFYPAQAQITGNQVKVWCSQVKEPVAVRYAWSDSPITANLFSMAGLPASPFRSDNFPEITAGKKLQLFK
jgi:sialate O-acetylesterase